MPTPTTPLPEGALLLTVAESWRVPGLGIIACGTTDAALRGYALHAALPVEVVFADGQRQALGATVEEIEHASHTRRGLLLAFEDPTPLPPGTRLVSTESILLSDNSMPYSGLR